MRVNGQGWSVVGRTACFVVVAAGAAWLASCGWAADRGDAPSKAPASELDVMPSDGVAVVSFRFGDLWNDAAFKPAREKMTKEVPNFTDDFVKSLGVALDDIERVTGILQSVESRANWLVFITTTKPYDAKKILAAAPNATEEKVKGRTFHVNPKESSIALLTERTFAMGPEEEVRRYLKHDRETKDGPLTPALRAAASKHLIVAGADLPTIAEALPKDLPPQMAAFKALLKAQSAVVTEDWGEDVKAQVRLTFAGESDAEAGEKAANAALDMARAGLVNALQEIGKQKEMARFVPSMEAFQTGLRAVKVERNGSVVEASLTAKVDLASAGPDMIDAIQKVRDSAARMVSMNNLKQLVLAMHNYHDTYNHFPPAAICDKNGKPLLSWRVAILPYIEQDALYKEFHLDEPWDSDHNKKLLEKMPPLYGFGDDKAAKNHETHYQGFIGKGAFFEGKKGVNITDITDGTSNTLMLVEAKESVPWSKPDDVAFDEGNLAPKVGGLFDGIFNAAFCDGSVRSLKLDIKEETLRALITRNGGEVVDPGK